MAPQSTQDAHAANIASWEARTQAWSAHAAAAQAAGIQLPGSDGVKIDPKDIRVDVGPPMTEAQFKAWQARRQKALKKNSQ
jgi:hypothetical protein